MNPSHGLSWEKSGEQEGVFATLFILTRNLSVRYNADTDTIQVYYNGAWQDCLKAQMQQFDIITNGKIQLDSGKINAYAYAYSGAPTGTATAPTISEITGAIQIKESWNQSEGSRYGSAFLTPAFDVTNWDKLVLDFDAHAANQYCEWYFGLTPSVANNYVKSCGHTWYNSLTLEKELDVSSLEGNYYLVAFVRGANNTSSYLNIKNVYLK